MQTPVSVNEKKDSPPFLTGYQSERALEHNRMKQRTN